MRRRKVYGDELALNGQAFPGDENPSDNKMTTKSNSSDIKPERNKKPFREKGGFLIMD